MGKYANEFEEAIANVPYSTDWFEMRNDVMSIIDKYYDKMDFFRTFQSTPTDDPNRIRSLMFVLYGEQYMYNECLENGLIETGQLDRIIHISGWNDCVSIVLYSHIANAKPLAPIALKYYKAYGLHEIKTHLNKG